MPRRKSRETGRKFAASAATLAVLSLYVFAGYLIHLNRRLGAELMGLQWRAPSEIVSVLDREASEPVARVYGSDWRVTPPLLLEEMPSHLADAFLAAEDARFRRHPGIDPIGIARALLANVRSGSVTQGGSTLNQQLIKAKFLTSERTMRRKIVEALLAVVLDLRMSKDEILEAYLNEVYLGHHAGRPVLGVDEGARLYFDKKPEKLSVGEAALLASIVRAPNRDTPDKRPERARARRDAILAEMRERDWITEESYREALEEKARFRRGSIPEPPFPHYLAALRHELVKQIGEEPLRRGRLRIVCEVDTAMQGQAERAIRNGVSSLLKRYSWLRRRTEEPLQAALLSIDPAGGGVRALVGGADGPLVDRTRVMQRQPGSAFKTFAYLAAIESREFTSSSLLLDAPLTVRLSSKDTWEPHNYDERFRGRVTLREAFEKSLNVPTVRLAGSVGIRNVVRTAKDAGFGGEMAAVPALPLGVSEVTVRDLTRAYTVFPNGGLLAPEPFLLTEVRDASGKLLFRRKPAEDPRRVVSPEAAYVTHSLLRGVVRRGTASRLKRYDAGHAAGKTGTTSAYRDAWFVGYTPNLVTTVWIGFDRGAPIRLSSAEAALPIWGSYVSRIASSTTEIDPPEGVVFRNIDPESGFLWAEGCPGPLREVYLAGTEPTRRCPRGFFGKIVRDILFDSESFDEPAAITFEKFRKWSAEVEQQRKEVEGTIEALLRLLRRASGEDKR